MRQFDALSTMRNVIVAAAVGVLGAGCGADGPVAETAANATSPTTATTTSSTSTSTSTAGSTSATNGATVATTVTTAAVTATITSTTTATTTTTTTATTTTATQPAPPATTVRCVVRLHGKGGGGSATTQGGGVTNVNPNGNAPGWNGRQWLYFPESGYAEARKVVADAIAAARCTGTIVKGFSNGASFAAKLACRGERFGNTVHGYIVDDPVVDRAVEGCQRPSDVKLALYWTGDINIAPGWDCRPSDWTCEGGVSIGIDAYEKALGVTRKKSVHSSHREYSDPPELTAWW